MTGAKEAIVSKSRFAEICNVTPGAVTQWITNRKITGDALIGEGRSAKIHVAIAQRLGWKAKARLENWG